MRKMLSFLVTVALVASACGSGVGGDQSAGRVPESPVEPASKIVFWHSMSGVNGGAVKKIVDGFNESQSKTTVEAIFQGTYDDSLAKLNTALGSSSGPALIQVYDIGQRLMIDLGEIAPMQDFVDRDQSDLSDFEPAVLNYYRVSNRLYSMPFNSSSAILYYNKDAFREAGLDPDRPPKTFAEVTEYAKKLTKKQDNGQLRYGFHQSIYGWLFEQYLAVSGGQYADNSNGRDARATKVTFNDARGKAILDWWKAGVDGGYFWNPGVDNDGAANAFNAGRSAMYVESTARLRGHISATQGKFEVGTGLYPRPADTPAEAGNMIGGASLYIMKNRPAAEQQAAWNFVKYAASPSVQAQWQADTGYYAARRSAQNEAVAKQWTTQFPQFTTALTQIEQAPQNRVTQGAVLGVFPQSRSRIQKAIESVLLGQSSSEEALNAAAADVNHAIDTYNKSVGP